MDKMYQRLLSETKVMLEYERPINSNNSNWGLNNVELLENTI